MPLNLDSKGTESTLRLKAKSRPRDAQKIPQEKVARTSRRIPAATFSTFFCKLGGLAPLRCARPPQRSPVGFQNTFKAKSGHHDARQHFLLDKRVGNSSSWERKGIYSTNERVNPQSKSPDMLNWPILCRECLDNPLVIPREPTRENPKFGASMGNP